MKHNAPDVRHYCACEACVGGLCTCLCNNMATCQHYQHQMFDSAVYSDSENNKHDSLRIKINLRAIWLTCESQFFDTVVQNSVFSCIQTNMFRSLRLPQLNEHLVPVINELITQLIAVAQHRPKTQRLESGGPCLWFMNRIFLYGWLILTQASKNNFLNITVNSLVVRRVQPCSVPPSVLEISLV